MNLRGIESSFELPEAADSRGNVAGIQDHVAQPQSAGVGSRQDGPRRRLRGARRRGACLRTSSGDERRRTTASASVDAYGAAPRPAILRCAPPHPRRRPSAPPRLHCTGGRSPRRIAEKEAAAPALAARTCAGCVCVLSNAAQISSMVSRRTRLVQAGDGIDQ